MSTPTQRPADGQRGAAGAAADVENAASGLGGRRFDQ
jgi:hypothetical protein